MKKLIAGLFLVMVALGLMAPSAEAIKTGESISGPVIVNDADGDGVVSVGDTVRFDVQNASTYPRYPYVNVECHDASGTLVYLTGGYLSTTTLSGHTFLLQSGLLVEGVDADCRASTGYFTLRNPASRELAATAFHVVG